MLTRITLQFDACVVGVVGLEGGERVHEARGVFEQHGSCLATSLNDASCCFPRYGAVKHQRFVPRGRLYWIEELY